MKNADNTNTVADYIDATGDKTEGTLIFWENVVVEYNELIGAEVFTPFPTNVAYEAELTVSKVANLGAKKYLEILAELEEEDMAYGDCGINHCKMTKQYI